MIFFFIVKNHAYTKKLQCKECDPCCILERWTSGNDDIDKFIKDTIYNAQRHPQSFSVDWIDDAEGHYLQNSIIVFDKINIIIISNYTPDSIVKGYTLSERYEEIPKVSDFSDSSETSEPSDSNARVKGPFLINDDDKTR
ncbi:hypothetical protein RhiirA1_473090 [Rhizophagus irregularis]|uniref:Uncharacterized protein n=1 Tax=Rhizophagus irregularis TaxID=588596 RepID=A0A2N0R189_9GLOM|nr:hypothetical protein RhiirA1_473090 [Rhizophagus irregularis]